MRASCAYQQFIIIIVHATSAFCNISILQIMLLLYLKFIAALSQIDACILINNFKFIHENARTHSLTFRIDRNKYQDIFL